MKRITNEQFKKRLESLIEIGEEFVFELGQLKRYLKENPLHAKELSNMNDIKELNEALVNIGKQIDNHKS